MIVRDEYASLPEPAHTFSLILPERRILQPEGTLKNDFLNLFLYIEDIYLYLCCPNKKMTFWENSMHTR